MSSILYPDNKHRGDRVEQLATQIGMIQGEAQDCIRNNDNNTSHAQDELKEILKAHNYETIDDLLKDLEKLLPPDQKQRYQDMMKQYKDWDDATKKVFEITTAVGFLAGVMKYTAIPIITVLDTGALVAGLDLVGRGWIALLRGEEWGLAMMQAGLTTFRALREGVDLSETAERIAAGIRTASSVLLVISVTLDGILLIYAAIQGAAQREALREATVQLCGRRFVAAQTKDRLQITNNQTAQAGAILDYYNVAKELRQTDEEMKPFMDKMTQRLIDNLKSDLDKITNESVWKELDEIDSSSGAWRNEDPNLGRILDWISTQHPLDSKEAVTDVVLPLRAQVYEKEVFNHKLSLYQTTAATANLATIMAGGCALK